MDVTDSVTMEDKDWNASKDYTLIWLSLGGHSVLPVSGEGEYYANDHAYNGVDILSYLEVDEKNVRTEVDANAAGATSYSGAEFPMSNGGVYAPVLVYVAADNTIWIRVLETYAAEKNFYITLKSGFTWVNDRDEKLTVNEDITYGYVDGVFTRTTIDHSIDKTDSVTVSENKGYRTVYNVTAIDISLGGTNLLPQDGGKAYYVNDNAAKNGVDLAEYIYINDVSVRTIVAGNTTYKHSSSDLFPMNNGGVYAPILVQVDTNVIRLKIMQEYADFASFTLTIKPFRWINSDGEELAVKEEKTFVYLGDDLVNPSKVPELGNVYYAGSSADPWNANGNYQTVKLAFADVQFTDAIRELSPFVPMDTANYQYLQQFVLINGESVKTINERGGYTAPNEFPANEGAAYAVPVQLCLMTNATGWEEDGLYLRIQKEYYNDLTELRVTLDTGLCFKDGDAYYRLSEAYTYTVFGQEVTVTIQDYSGAVLQTLTYIKGDEVALPDVSGKDSVLLGWLINDELCKPTAKITVESAMTVKAVIANFKMKDGASIRVTGNSGIRFTYQFNGTDWDTYASYIAESGIMLLPTDTLYGQEFILDNFTRDINIIVGQGNEKHALVDGNYEYVLRLVNIKDKNCARAFSARGYLLIKYADGSQGYVYTKYSDANNSRSIMEIAQAYKNDPAIDFESLPQEIKDNVNRYINTGEAYVPEDFVIEVGELTVDAIKAAYAQAVALSEELSGYGGDIVIQLPSGTLELTETLSFDAVTRVNDKTIRFLGNDTLISGGKSYTGGWSEYGKGIYSLYVGTEYAGVRQLYVNGVPATLARTAQTTGTWDTNNKKLIVAQSALGTLPSGAMEVSTLERWAQSYGVIESVATSGSNYVFTFTAASGYVYFEVTRGYADANSALFLQNNLQFLDAENEYYYDSATGMLYYKPAEGADINGLSFTLPVLETVMTTKNMVAGVTFEGINFAYSNYAAPSTYGYLEQQANVYSSYEEGHSWKVLPKMITVLSDNVTFTGCSIYGTGAGGIGVERGASNVTIDGNSFSYTAGTAIFVGDNEDSNDNLPTNIVITNNTVSSYGMAYGGAAGITVTYADTVTVSHNTVQNGYYSGISLGWGWTKNANVQHRNYTVTYNRIVNAMAGTLYDGGGIYLLGNFVADSTNVVANNYVEISATCLAAIYLDEGTSDYAVYNNALKVNTGNTDKGCIFLHNKLNSKTAIGLQNIEIYDNYSNYKTCGYKYSRNGVGPLWASAYNSTYSVSYENATVSSTEHINESIYANSGANVA